MNTVNQQYETRQFVIPASYIQSLHVNLELLPIDLPIVIKLSLFEYSKVDRPKKSSD